MTVPTNAPARKPRLLAVDATRGVALLGMMAVHSLLEETAPGHPTLAFAIFGGRAAATFAVLAGVGMAFMTGRRRVKLTEIGPTAAMLAMRALVIGLIGLSLGYADAAYAAVILPYYAILFLLAIPLVILPSWAIGAVGVVVVSVVPPVTHLLQPHLPVPTLANPAFGYAFGHPLALLSELAITGEYPALPWMAYICVGLIVGRLSLGRIRVAVTLLATGTFLAVGSAVTSSILLNRFGGLKAIWAAQPPSVLTVPETTDMLVLGGDGTTPTSTNWWLAVDAPHTSTAPDLIGTSGSAIALLGLLLLLGHLSGPVLRRIVTVVFTPLAAAGSMTLTLYTAHIMFLNSDYDTYSPDTGYLLQVIAVLVLGLAWRATAGRGPLEALVTALATRAKRWVGGAAAAVPPVAAGLAACGSGSTPDNRPLAVVYRGKASCAGCSEAVATLLRNNPLTPFRTEYCGPDEAIPLTEASLAKAMVYAQPGGGTLEQGWRHMRDYAGVITGFVRNGGHYLGFCLGGYLAGATPGFTLLPGDTSEYISTPGADVHTTDDTIVKVIWQGRERYMFFQDGPNFVLKPGAAATVLARYPNGTIAALVAPYGKGQVGVVGPHPEAPQSWYRDVRRINPDGIRPDLGYDFVQSTIHPAPVDPTTKGN